MEYFEKSQHRNFCILSKDKIYNSRSNVNESFVKTIISVLPEDLCVLSVEEEFILYQYYHSKIPEICRHFKFPPSVTPLSHWYLTRYSLKHSIMEYDAKHVMLSCILLASKCENLHLTLEQYAGRIPNTSGETLLELELVLLEALQYRITFFSPFTALTGLFHLLNKNIQVDEELYGKAISCLQKISATDALIMYRPSRLAYLSLMMASCSVDLDGILKETRINEGCEESLKESLNIVNETLLQSSNLDMTIVKSIDRRQLQIRKIKL